MAPARTMGKNYSKNPATDATKVRTQTQVRYFVEGPDGVEERLDRRPMGKVERFVDREGNVVQRAMFVEGDQHKTETERRNRANLHAKGFIELGECPIAGGNHQHAREFAKMPTNIKDSCKFNPRLFEKRGRDVFAQNGCPHMQWLIEHRRAEAAKAYALRNAHVAAAERARAEEENLKALQAELLREQIKERKSKTRKGEAAAE